jgi:NADH-quinone oxidoreductase subunit M
MIVIDWSFIVTAIPVLGAVTIGVIAFRQKAAAARLEVSPTTRIETTDIARGESKARISRRVASLSAACAFVAVLGLSLLDQFAGPKLAVGGNFCSVAFALLTTATWLPVIYLARCSEHRRPAVLYGTLLLLEASYLAIFSCDNAIWLCASLQINSVLLYFLLAGWSRTGEGIANKLLLVNLAADFAILIGLLGIVIALGRSYGAQPLSAPRLTYSLSEITRDFPSLTTDDVAAKEYWKHAQRALLTVLLLGAGIKAALVPFHAWFASAVADGPPCVGLALVGPGLRIGLYLLVRFIGPLEADLGPFAELIIGVTILGALHQALLAFGQAQLKRMIACVCLLQGSLTVAATISMSPASAGGPVMLSLASAVAGVLMLFSFDFFELRFGGSARRAGEIPIVPASLLGQAGGIVHKLPNLSAVLLVAALSLVGIPGLFGFPGLYATLGDIFSGELTLAFLAIAASLIGSWALFSMLQKLVFGTPRLPMPDDAEVLIEGASTQEWSIVEEGPSGPIDLGPTELLVLGPLLASLVILGIWPQIIAAALHSALAPHPSLP